MQANWDALVVGLQGAPTVIAAILLVFIDGLYAFVRHVSGRRPDTDPPVLEYVEARVTILFVLLVAAILDPLIPDIPLLNATAIFYVGVSLANILDYAERDGVPLPETLVTVVRGLKGALPGTTKHSTIQ